MEERKSTGWKNENNTKKGMEMVEQLVARRDEKKYKLSSEKSRESVHSIIQVLKEKPELSMEDWESNSLHSELVHLLRRSTGWIRIHLHY